jgi:tetratricopeptide (TPR) repeat protein
VRPEHLDRLEREVDTLRDALRHAAADPDPTAEVEIASGLWRFWWVRGYLAEGLEICESILARRGFVPTPEGVRVIRSAASLAWTTDRVERASVLALEALSIARAIGDAYEEVSALNLLGVIGQLTDDFANAKVHLAEAIERADAAAMPSLVATARLNLGVIHLELGELDEARALLLDVLAQREREAATEGVAFAHLNLGTTELSAGNLAVAEAHYVAAVAAFGGIGFPARQANAIQGLAAVEAQTGRAIDAARHLGAAAAMLTPTGWGRNGSGPGDTATRIARDALGDDAFDAAFEEGRSADASRP